MRLLADTLLESNLRLPDGSDPLVLTDPNGEFTLTLENADAKDGDAALKGRLLFEADDVLQSRDRAEGLIALALNALTLATVRRFKLHTIKCIIDWTPGIPLREALYYSSASPLDLTEPDLRPEYRDTSEFLLASLRSGRQQAAQRWFRLGVQALNVDDQFAYFWFALEILAEETKGKEKVNSLCPHCRSALFCEECDKYPEHRKYVGEAIKALVQRIVPDGGEKIFEVLQNVRHALMHGERISSVVIKLDDWDDGLIMDALSHITRQAMLDIALGQEGGPERVHLFEIEDIRNQKVHGTVHVNIGVLGDPNALTFDMIPTVNVSLEVRPMAEDAKPKS